MKLITRKVCKTSDIGVNENLFGGTMLAWLDEAAAIMACDLADSKKMVTIKIDEVLFKQPVKVSDHIYIYGILEKLGNSSITLILEARRRNYSTEEIGIGYHNKETLVVNTQIKFVQIDEQGKSLKFTDRQKAHILQIQ